MLVLFGVGALVPPAIAGRLKPGRAPPAAPSRLAAGCAGRAGRAGGADFLQAHLPGEPEQLFYVLPDRTKFGLLGSQAAQLYLFIFLAAVRGRYAWWAALSEIASVAKRVVWVSVLGRPALHADAAVTRTCSGPPFWSVIIGLVLASAFSAIVVYAQELVPGKVGTISGLFFGFAFGLGGVGAAVSWATHRRL